MSSCQEINIPFVGSLLEYLTYNKMNCWLRITDTYIILVTETMYGGSIALAKKRGKYYEKNQ